MNYSTLKVDQGHISLIHGMDNDIKTFIQWLQDNIHM